MCKNWREKGECKYGVKCLFAHGTDELTERVLPEKVAPVKPVEKKEEIIKIDVESPKISESKVEEVKLPEKPEIDSLNTDCGKKAFLTPETQKTKDVTPKSFAGSQAQKCLDSALAALAGQDMTIEHENEDQLMLINGEYNDLLDREIPKASSYDREEMKKTTSPYSGKGNSTHPSSTNKSPLEAYTDSADYRMGGATPSKVTSNSSQRSSFDDSINQSDHYCAKNRLSVMDTLVGSEASPSKIVVDTGLLKVYRNDSEDQLSSEEENLIAESTSAIESLFGGRKSTGINRPDWSRLIISEDLDDETDI